MTINEAAIRLLAYFSPEEREIPDHADYPGRNAAVAGALNAGLQKLFADGGPWTRKDERGALLHPPTTITLTASAEATTLAVTSGWESWMTGCSIIIDGHEAENQIRGLHSSGFASATINPAGTNNTIELTAQNNGSSGNDISFEIAAAEFAPELVITITDSAIVATPIKGIRVSGSLTSNGTTVVTFPLLLPVTSTWFTSDGNETPPASGTWYQYIRVIGQWVLQVYVNGVETTFWESTFSETNPTDPLSGDIVLVGASPATGTPSLAAETITTAAEVVAAINTNDEAASLVVASLPALGTGTVAVVAETHLTGGSNLISVKIPYGGTTGSHGATVYQDSITIGNDVLEVNDQVKANGIRLVGQPAGGGPAYPSTFNDYGATVIRTPFQPMQIDITSTAQPMFYSITTWTEDATTPDRLRMNISPAPDRAGTLTYDVLLLPPAVSDLASTDELPIPFGMAESIFLPIAVMNLFDSPFLRGMTAPDAVTTKYQLAMEQLGEVDPQKKNPRFVIRG